MLLFKSFWSTKACTTPNPTWRNLDVLLKASSESAKVPTIVFICRKDIPHNRKHDATYAQVCVNYSPEKEAPNCTQVTVGGNLLHNPGNCSTPTIDMITVKLHLNSIISRKNAHYCTIDLKDFYLNTPWSNQNTCACRSSTSLLILSKPTTSLSWLPTTVQSMSKYRRAYTVSRNWASLHRIYMKNASINMATIKGTLHWAFGNMTGGLSCSLSVSTTLALSTMGRSMPFISWRFLRNTTNIPLTRTETDTLAWTWTRTTTATRSMSQCSTTSPRP